MTRLHYLTIFISGPYIVQGKYGNAIFTPNTASLNDKVINLGTHENDCLGKLSLCPKGLTFSLWFKLDPHTDIWRNLFTSTHFTVSLVKVSGVLKLNSFIRNGTHQIKHVGLTVITPYTWSHFGFTYSVNYGSEFFHNGCKLTNPNPVITAKIPDIRNFQFGCYRGEYCTKAAYDDFRFWTAAKDEQFMWWLWQE